MTTEATMTTETIIQPNTVDPVAAKKLPPAAIALVPKTAHFIVWEKMIPVQIKPTAHTIFTAANVIDRNHTTDYEDEKWKPRKNGGKLL